MALTKKQIDSLANVEGLPLGKIICIVKAAIKLYKCVTAAKGDVGKIAECVKTFIADVEKCVKGS